MVSASWVVNEPTCVNMSGRMVAVLVWLSVLIAYGCYASFTWEKENVAAIPVLNAEVQRLLVSGDVVRARKLKDELDALWDYVGEENFLRYGGSINEISQSE